MRWGEVSKSSEKLMCGCWWLAQRVGVEVRVVDLGTNAQQGFFNKAHHGVLPWLEPGDWQRYRGCSGSSSSAMTVQPRFLGQKCRLNKHFRDWLMSSWPFSL